MTSITQALPLLRTIRGMCSDEEPHQDIDAKLAELEQILRSRPSITNRDRLYEALREAGPDGIAPSDLYGIVPVAGQHILSLMLEGHRIDWHDAHVRGHQHDRCILIKDAWA